jgi:hypothetical protein
MTLARPAGTLKQATADLVTALRGQQRAADLCGVSQTMIMKYTVDSEDYADTTIPVGRLRTLELAADDPIVTRFLAAELNCVLLRMPRAIDKGQLAERASKVGSTFGPLFDHVSKALSPSSDGGASVTVREAGGLVSDLDALIEAAMEMRGGLVAIRDGEGR